MIKNFIRYLARKNGLMVIPASYISSYILMAGEYSKIAEDYEDSDPYLSGVNNGRNDALLMVLEAIKKNNPV